jgi:hypothetical protein
MTIEIGRAVFRSRIEQEEKKEEEEEEERNSQYSNALCAFEENSSIS